MPRFFLHIETPEGLVPDNEGFDYLSELDAEAGVLLTVRDLHERGLLSPDQLKGWNFRLADEGGKTIKTYNLRQLLHSFR